MTEDDEAKIREVISALEGGPRYIVSALNDRYGVWDTHERTWYTIGLSWEEAHRVNRIVTHLYRWSTGPV